MRTLPVGTRLTCPKCTRTMAILIKPLHDGEIITASHAQEVLGVVAKHEPLICPADGELYGKRDSVTLMNILHTKDGWK